LTTAIVADNLAVGVHRDTLLRWLRLQLIPEPQRDHRGWRVFSSRDIDVILRFAKDGISEPASTYSLGKHASSLHTLDWDFADATTNYLTHALHPYPAKFIPQIPNALIQELSSVGDTVLDIFCGSGTTLLESLLLKRNAVGIDANPLACLVSRAKTTTLSRSEMDSLSALSVRAQELAASLTIPIPNLFSDQPFQSDAPRPSNDAISFWFEPFIVEELAEILSWCNRLPTANARQLALTAFSSIIVSVSKQDSDTRYVRRTKNLEAGAAFLRFARVLLSSLQAVSELANVIEPRFQCNVLNWDILSKPTIEAVDLVVSSPPYPNAYSYHLYHMTRMLWLGMDQNIFKKQEIGSHRKYSNKGANGATVDTFRSEFERIFTWLSTILKRNRYACFVVGDSTLRGKKVNNCELISSEAARYNFHEEARIQRTIRATRKAFNPHIGKIKTENILVLRYGG